MSDFRKHLPAGCPPDDHENANGVCFRLVKGASIGPDDFMSYAESQGPGYDGFTACKWAGVSLFGDRADAEALTKLRGANAGKRIAKGTLTAEMGVMRDTPNRRNKSHVTYWPYESAEPWAAFDVEADADAEQTNG